MPKENPDRIKAYKKQYQKTVGKVTKLILELDQAYRLSHSEWGDRRHYGWLIRDTRKGRDTHFEIDVHDDPSLRVDEDGEPLAEYDL